MNNEIAEIAEFVKKRDEVLNKFDIKLFTQWLHDNNPQILEQIYFFNSTAQAEKVLFATMCKLCIGSIGVSEEVKTKAKKELDKLGMSYGLE